MWQIDKQYITANLFEGHIMFFPEIKQSTNPRLLSVILKGIRKTQIDRQLIRNQYHGMKRIAITFIPFSLMLLFCLFNYTIKQLSNTCNHQKIKIYTLVWVNE